MRCHFCHDFLFDEIEMIWVIIGYMWLFIHRPFEVWPILGTLRLERVYMLCALIAWAVAAEKQLTENRINFAIALFAFAMTVSAVMCPYRGLGELISYQNWLKLVVFYFLVMTSVKTEKDLKLLLTAFVVCLFLYMLHSYREYLCGRYKYVMGTYRMIGVDSSLNDPNAFGSSIVILLPMLLPLITILKQKWHYLFLAGYLLLSARCVQLTGSRSAFLVLGVSTLIAALISKRRMTYVPLLFLLAVVVWFSLSDNLKSRYLSTIDSSVNESANESARGRIDGFFDGWKNWANSPIWGVGPECHGLATGRGLLSHCLYGQIPGELGSLGILAMLSLLACFALNHRQIVQDMKFLKRHGREKDGKYLYLASMGIMISIILLLVFGLGGHNGYRYNWVWCAAFQATATSLMSEKVRKLKQRELLHAPPYRPAGIPTTAAAG